MALGRHSRNENVPNACFMSQLGAVGYVFQIGKRLGIGVGNARLMVLLAEGYQLLRRQFVMVGLIGRNLRDIMVLAVQAAEVAARASQ